MEQDDTWELLDEPSAVKAAPQLGRRLTRRQKLLRAAGASLAVLVALTVIASQFGYLDFTRDLWNNIRLARTSTLVQTTLAAHAMERIQTSPWEKIPLPVAANLLEDVVVAPTNPATAYACSAVTPVDQSGGRPSGGLLFWSTQDAGRQWLTLPLIGALGTGCTLSVAPDDPRMLLSLVYRDPMCTASMLYLTQDGGMHWHQLGQLPSVPYDLHYCYLWVTGTTRHLLIRQWYERNDVKEDDPQRYGVAMYHSEDSAQTWHAGALVDTYMGFPTFLADGATLLTTDIRLDSPTEGYTTLWVSTDAGDNWNTLAKVKNGFEATRILVASGMHTATPSFNTPIYLLKSPTLPSRMLRLQIAQITDSQHWATLPPLPIAGASAERLGITQALTVTPSGKLLALGLGPDDRVPQDGQYDDKLFARQWLWEWDPRLTRWSVVTPALDVPWPRCSDGCWTSYITQNGPASYLWLRPWDSSGDTGFYRIRLPA